MAGTSCIPLPLPASDRLLSGYALREGFDPFGTSPLEYGAFKTRVAALESVGLARRQFSTVRASGDPVRRVRVVRYEGRS